eukprot:scaffold20257_cov121-Isochrysis_galbana.AAC.1
MRAVHRAVCHCIVRALTASKRSCCWCTHAKEDENRKQKKLLPFCHSARTSWSPRPSLCPRYYSICVLFIMLFVIVLVVHSRPAKDRAVGALTRGKEGKQTSKTSKELLPGIEPGTSSLRVTRATTVPQQRWL